MTEERENGSISDINAPMVREFWSEKRKILKANLVLLRDVMKPGHTIKYRAQTKLSSLDIC